MKLRPRFTLAWWLAFITVFAAALTFILRPAMIRIHARRQIERFGGSSENWYVEGWYWETAVKVLGDRASPINAVHVHALDVGDDELRFLKKLPELISLDLSFTNVTDTLLVPVINNATGLEYVELDCTLAGDGVARVAGSRYYESFGMRQSRVTLSAAKELELPNISPMLSEEFREQMKLVSRCAAISERGELGAPNLYVWCNADKLKVNSLDADTLSALEAISEFTSYVCLDGVITPDMVKVVSQLKPKSLRIENADCGDMGWLTGLKETRRLGLEKCVVHELKVPSGLVDLGIQGTLINCVDLQNLPASISKLECAHVGWTDQDLQHLGSLPQLISLDLCGNALTDHAVSMLEPYRLQLDELCLSGTLLTDDSLPMLFAFKQLRILNLGGTKITGKHFERIAELPNLELLMLASTRLSKAALNHLSGIQVFLYDATILP